MRTISLSLSRLVRVRAAGIRGQGGAAAASSSFSSMSPVAEDAVRAAAPFFVLFFALCGGLAELPGLLVNAATLRGPAPHVLVIHRVAGPLDLFVRLSLAKFDGQASSLLLGRRWCSGLHRLRDRLTGRPRYLRHSNVSTHG